MTITLLQQDIRWGSPADNHQMAEAAITAAPPSDVYVLPEMWSTGFAVKPDGIAEPDGMPTLAWMQRMADRLDAAVAGSVAVEQGGRYYNRFYFVMPGVAPIYYDKRHLFSYGGEHERYTPGNERVTVEWRGVRFLLQVCYDLRFPVFSRNSASDPYDVILYVASWPDSRRMVWDTLLHARAIENQCYVCGVNRIGSDPVCHYDGGTVAIDAYGKSVVHCPDNAPSAITFELDIPRMQRFREKFPVLRDAD